VTLRLHQPPSTRSLSMKLDRPTPTPHSLEHSKGGGDGETPREFSRQRLGLGFSRARYE